MRFTLLPPKTVFMKRHCFPASLVSISAMLVSMCQKISLKCKRVRDAAFFLIIMLVTFAATLLKPQKYVSSRTIQKCVEHVSTST